MKISKLKLINFRNYKKCFLNFSDMVTVFYGKNGQGKTNLLEGIFYASFGLSHRTAKEEDMINFSSDGMAVMLDFKKEDGNHVIGFKKYRDQGKFHKEIKIDNKKVTAKDHYGYINVVMFSPEDLQIIKGDPALRRRFMDMEISQTDPLYYSLLVKYRRTLRQRNSLLKMMRDQGQTREQIDIWDEEIADTGAQLLVKRLQNIKKIKEISLPVFNTISDFSDSMDIKYEMKGNDGSLFYPEEENIEDIKHFYVKSLKERRYKDIMQGNTGIGVHRDDFKTFINGIDAKSFSSQGQQRCFALALKLSQIEYVNRICGEYPVLLLDDVMSELDQHRRSQLIGFITDKVQTFITVNDKALVPDFSSNSYFKVENGIVKEETDGRN